MKIIENSIIPPKGFAAINLFGVLFVPFYVLYVLEWLVKLCFYGSKAYRNISFEREAYSNDEDTCYLLVRRHYAFLKYIFF